MPLEPVVKRREEDDASEHNGEKERSLSRRSGRGRVQAAGRRREGVRPQRQDGVLAVPLRAVPEQTLLRWHPWARRLPIRRPGTPRRRLARPPLAKIGHSPWGSGPGWLQFVSLSPTLSVNPCLLGGYSGGR